MRVNLMAGSTALPLFAEKPPHKIHPPMKFSPFLLLTVLGPLIGHSQLFAQATWTGLGSVEAPALWSDSLNWSGTAPSNNGSTALIFLNSAANSVSSNDLTGLTATSISVPANDGGIPTAVNIKDNAISGNAISLTGGITVGTGNWQTFNFDIALGNAARAMAISNGRLYLGGVLSGTGGALTKSGGGDLWLLNSNTFTGSGNNVVNSSIPGAGTYPQGLLFSGTGSGNVVIQNTAALGSASNSIRFTGNGSGNLNLQTNGSVNSWSVFSGSGHGGTITAGRATAGAGFIHTLGVLDLSSVTMTVNTGANITSGTAGVSFTALSMSGGNDNNPVTLAGSAAINIGTAGITNNSHITRRLQLDGTNASNTIGAISDLAPGAAAGSGKVNLIKANSSTWTLTGNNTYTGTTTLNSGVLQLGNGGTSGALSASSAITNNAILAISRSNTVTQGIDFAPTLSGTGSLRKSGSGNLILSGANLTTGTARDVLVFSGGGSGTVTLTHSAALGAAGNTIRFSGGGSGVLDLQTDTSVNAYNIASGAFNGGTIVANRATSGDFITHTLGSLELSSVTLTINTGSNVNDSASLSFTELKMSGGNDNNPVTLAGDADISFDTASITNNGFPKRLRLDGTSPNNTVNGVISDTNNATTGAKVNLIKSNSGTWHLKGNNTYTGDTTVSGGRLKLDFPCLDDSAALSVDGVLELNHASVDTVGSLTLGGNLKGPGEYNQSNSDGFITGSGTIKVLGANAFDTWAAQTITAIQPLADASAAGDPDADGTSNLAEFAFNGNPLSGADSGSVHVFTADSDDVGTDKELILTLAVRKETPAAPAFSGSPLELSVAGITYTIEGSVDLSSFNASVSEVTPITNGLPDLGANPDYEYRSFSLGGSNGLPGKGFLRVKVRN
jgi:autotransporter-associated beta strand protein